MEQNIKLDVLIAVIKIYANNDYRRIKIYSIANPLISVKINISDNK